MAYGLKASSCHPLKVYIILYLLHSKAIALEQNEASTLQ